MTIKKAHDWIIFLLDKNGAEHKSHEQIDEVLDRAQMDVFVDYTGNPKTYQPGRPVPIIAFGENQTISNALSRFRTHFDFVALDNPAGLLDLPADCICPLPGYTLVYSNQHARNLRRPLVPVNEEELIKRLESQLIPVTLYDPIALYNVNRKMQLFPEQPQIGRVYYLRRPAVPHYAYTVFNRAETHDASTSQDLEWDDTVVGDILAKALKYLGVNMSSADLVNFGELRDKSGS